MASTTADLGGSSCPRPGDLVSACLHPADPALAGRPALATRAGSGWTELTYRDLDRRSRAVAAWLGGRGVRPGQRVGLLGDGSGDWVAAFFGILRAGAVVVPLDPGLAAGDLGRVCDQARPAAMALSRRLAGASAALRSRLRAPLPSLILDDVASLPEPADDLVAAERRGDEPAVVVWTAGTTGAPTGVTLSAANIAYVVAAMVHGQRLCRDDRILSVLPPHHMFELSCGLLATLAAGASAVFAGTLMPHEILRLVRERRITRMAAVPLLLKLLRNDLQARPSGPPQGRLGRHLQALYSGGAPLDPAIIDDFAALGVSVYQGYGLTETAPTVAMNTPARNRVGSVGRALPGTEIRIDGPAGAAEGEILVRSPAVMLGYCDDGALTRAAVDADG